MRAALWLTGMIAGLLYLCVGWFALRTLGPALGCGLSPEMRPWGYSKAAFDACFAKVPPQTVDAYRDVLTGVDRGLALALGAFLILLAIHYRAWPGALAALVYAITDWRENTALVSVLDGSHTVAAASVWTISKFITLAVALAMCWLYARRERRPQ